MNLVEQPKIKCEWTITNDVTGEVIYQDEPNFITVAGLDLIAAYVAGQATPFLVVGDDLASGETITEFFRKAVSSVIRTGPLIRFRTQLLSAECNGDHNKACIYYGASVTPGTGTMLNLLLAPWSKTSAMILTVEAKFTVTSG